jgi:hypothetical protein
VFIRQCKPSVPHLLCHELVFPIKSPAGTADKHPCPKGEWRGCFRISCPNTVYGSGRVPQVRPSVPPDFLLCLLALAYFMRLSLMKAAHAALGGAPCRKSGPIAVCPQTRNDRRGCAPSSSAHVRSGEHGAPVQGSGLCCWLHECTLGRTLIRLLAGAGAELLRLPDEQRHPASPDRTSRCDRGCE